PPRPRHPRVLHHRRRPAREGPHVARRGGGRRERAHGRSRGDSRAARGPRRRRVAAEGGRLIARAPGKLVLSGAYAVLEGAPCLVAAVDRYAVADASRPATFVTDEVRCAVAAGALARPPWFDASALRESAPDGTSRKLGLGSSAAILV